MKAVHEALAPLPGVAEVEIDFPNRIAHVNVDPEVFDTDGALIVLTNAGYPDSTATDEPSEG